MEVTDNKNKDLGLYLKIAQESSEETGQWRKTEEPKEKESIKHEKKQ